VHATTDSLGNPLRFVLTGAQTHDITQAKTLLEAAHALAQQLQQTITRLIADKGYDAEPLRELVRTWDVEPVIPYRQRKAAKSDKTESVPADTRPIDWHTYKERHLIECFFNRIKHYRRIFSRFDKLANRYLGFLSFVSALIWLK
jgi:transposase